MNTVDTDRANEFDVLIVGGGMVGASLAAALAPLQIRVGLVEAIPFQASAQPSYDDRVTVVAEGSRRILSTIGLWEHISAQTTPITKIHVSEKKRFGITRLNAEDYDVAALGYVVENRVLGAALGGYIDTRDSIDLICPAKLRSVKTDSVRVDVVITRGESEETLHTKLLVAADGARSLVREQLGIKARIWDYGQTAIVCNVTPEREHANQAYERFTNSGPVALLPMPDARCAVVWTVATTQAEQLLALPDDEFASRLQTVFGHRLGAFTRVGARHPYPLHLVRAQRQSSERVVIIGNAAHSLHPIAGQGFNLSLRDVAALAEVIFENQDDPGSAAVLEGYSAWRKSDQWRVIAFTDLLNRLFKNPLFPLGTVRSAGLLALDLLPSAKRWLGRQSMGLTGKQPRLARGIGLS